MWDVQLKLIDYEKNHRKFWRAKLEERQLFVNWGRIGTEGSTQVKEFESSEAAAAQLTKLAAGKRRKGYEEV